MNSILKMSTLCNPAISSQFKLLALARTISMKPVPAATGAAVKEGHAVRNERLGRPLSPHLSIYKPQITSVLSVTHRGTGVALTAYALALAGVGLTTDVNSVVSFIDGLQLSAPILLATKFVLAFPVSFHTANGVRHLVWDTGRALTIKSVYGTGYAMLGATVLINLVLTVL